MICNRAREILRWKDRTVNEILAGYNSDIYDSDDLHRRKTLSLAELHALPMEDEDGSEIPLYTMEGYKIERRLAQFSMNTQPHGVLVDLRKLDALFRQDDDDDLVDDDDQNLPRNKYYVYPQAGLVNAGHFQSTGLIAPIQRLLANLNNELQQESDSLIVGPNSPVAGISCQAYNSVMHATRGRTAQHHDAQKGLITSALAGAWATTYTTQHTARRLSDKCNAHYPHAEFREKISREAISRDLRVENVFTIDVPNLPLRLQSGGYVLITSPLR
jgi:hypothetical protein